MNESQTSTGVVHLDEYESGRSVSQKNYDSFIPSPVNQVWVWDDPRTNTLLEEATQALGELNAFSRIASHRSSHAVAVLKGKGNGQRLATWCRVDAAIPQRTALRPPCAGYASGDRWGAFLENNPAVGVGKDPSLCHNPVSVPCLRKNPSS